MHDSITFAFLETLLELFGNKDVQDELIETGRIYFTSNDVTINLVWSILILGLLGLGKLIVAFNVILIKFHCQPLLERMTTN